MAPKRRKKITGPSKKSTAGLKKAKARALTADMAAEGSRGMELEDQIPPSRRVSDAQFPGSTPHQVLAYAVNVLWATEDISAIRRVESTREWVMWNRNALPPA